MWKGGLPFSIVQQPALQKVTKLWSLTPTEASFPTYPPAAQRFLSLLPFSAHRGTWHMEIPQHCPWEQSPPPEPQSWQHSCSHPTCQHQLLQNRLQIGPSASKKLMWILFCTWINVHFQKGMLSSSSPNPGQQSLAMGWEPQAENSGHQSKHDGEPLRKETLGKGCSEHALFLFVQQRGIHLWNTNIPLNAERAGSRMQVFKQDPHIFSWLDLPQAPPHFQCTLRTETPSKVKHLTKKRKPHQYFSLFVKLG